MTVDEELRIFRALQADGSKREEERCEFYLRFWYAWFNFNLPRERTLLREWEEQQSGSKVDTTQTTHGGVAFLRQYVLMLTLESDAEIGITISASLFSTVWKIKCKPGDTVLSDTQELIILEAMKTEVPVVAGEGNAGRTVLRLGPGVMEGKTVRPGDALIVLE